MNGDGLAAAVEAVIQTTRAYLTVPSVVGFEAPFLDRLRADFAALRWDIEEQLGALILEAPWIARSAATLSVHIDRHGLLATGHGDLEYAAFAVREARAEEVPPASRGFLEKICGRFVGERLVAYEPETGDPLVEGALASSHVCPIRHRLVFKVPGFEELPEGTPVAFDPLCDDASEGITGQLDNAISVALAHTLASLGFAGRVVFTREEEIGNSWVHLLEALESRGDADSPLLVLDTSPFPPEAAMNDGVVLRRRDANGFFDEALVKRLEAVAVESEIPYLFKDEWIARNTPPDRQPSWGSTELGRLVAASEGRWNGATVQLPTRGYHSNRETASRRSIEGVLRLLRGFLDLSF